MISIKNRSLKTTILSAAFASCVYAGFIVGVDGAQNLAEFVIWLVALPAALIGQIKAVQEDMALQPPLNRFARFFMNASNWLVLGAVVWTGHPISGAVWAVQMLLSAMATSAILKIRSRTVSPSHNPKDSAA